MLHERRVRLSLQYRIAVLDLIQRFELQLAIWMLIHMLARHQLQRVLVLCSVSDSWYAE